MRPNLQFADGNATASSFFAYFFILDADAAPGHVHHIDHVTLAVGGNHRTGRAAQTLRYAILLAAGSLLLVIICLIAFAVIRRKAEG